LSIPASTGYVTDVAYVPGFYPHLAPAAMRYVAALNRVAPPRLADGFRALELGCGLGRTLTVLAAANPGGEFVGVDINPDHTKTATDEIAAAGLSNARIVTSDFAHLPGDIGTFDFITLHGVWSWVAPEVRDDILLIARERLAPGGLLLVSYNAMPGWAHLQPIRGILRQYAALRKGDSAQRVRDAVAYLDYMRQHKAKYFEDNPGAAAYVDTILGQDPRYLAHEYLNDHWTSFYFAEVAGQFAAAGLTFAGSLPVHTNFWDLCVAPGFQDLFRTTTDRLVTEAHKDFCANTMFRWDLYAKEPRFLPDLTARLRETDDIWYRLARPGITLPQSVNLGLVTSTVQGPLYEALLGMLSGGGMRLSEIVADPRCLPAQPADIARAVDAGVAMRLFDIATGPINGSSAPSNEPRGRYEIPAAFNRAILSAELFGGRGVPLASTLTGSALTLGDLDAAILHEWIAGGPDGLTERVDELMTARQRVINHEGKPITDPTDRLARLRTACENFAATVMPRLEEQGMVSPIG
jgi:SAM-dependent methyltransferase